MAILGGMGAEKAWGFYQTTPQTTPLWKTAFRGVGPGGIPVAAADVVTAPITGVTHYTLDINQFTDRVHPNPNFDPTTLWGYNPSFPLGGGTQPQKHLGGIIVAQKGVPIQITFNNNLPPTHIIPVDTSIDGANLAQNRAAVHLHGGFVPWISDGGPHSWFTRDGSRGPSFLNNILNPFASANQAEYYYPMQQSARFQWYHDHAVGITRLNAYAGIASALLIRDSFEQNLKNQGLPEYIETSVLGGTTVVELPLAARGRSRHCSPYLL